MYPQIILKLIQSCEDAARAGVCREEIRNRILPDKVQHLIKSVRPKALLDWAQEDPDYSFYYRELQDTGLTERPAEAAAMLLEAIVLDTLD
jgi:hypothetical protein